MEIEPGKNMMLPPIDDRVQPASLLLERVPIEADILRSKFEAERKATNQKILKLQEDLGQCHYDMEIQKDEIRKKVLKYERLLEDFKKLGLENVKSKKGSKGKASNPSKKMKIDEDKETKELQKEVEPLKKQVRQVKKEAFEASSKWEEKYAVDIEKHKRENIEMKIRLRAKKIKHVELSSKHQALLQSAFQYLQQDFTRQKRDFDALYEEYSRHVTQREEMIDYLWIVSEDWRVQLHGRHLYIDHLTKKTYKAISTS